MRGGPDLVLLGSRGSRQRCGVEGCGVEDIHIEGVSVEEAWARLKADPASVLIDVRTSAEWAYIGLPDLNGIGKHPVLVEWQAFSGERPNTAVVGHLRETLAAVATT